MFYSFFSHSFGLRSLVFKLDLIVMVFSGVFRLAFSNTDSHFTSPVVSDISFFDITHFMTL